MLFIFFKKHLTKCEVCNIMYLTSQYVKFLHIKKARCEDITLDWLKKLRGEKTMKEVATKANISESY